MAGGDAPPIFDAAEEVFDFVSSSIETLGAIGFPDGGATVRDDRQGAFVPDLLAHFSLSEALSAVTASGDRGVFSISSTTWLSWTCPPVTVEIFCAAPR